LQSSNFIFQRYRPVDKESFAKLLSAAKGERTISQFASQCGVSASTFSRILNKENKSASSPELLIAIANNAAPDSNVSLTKLARANGYHFLDRADSPEFYYRDNVKDRMIGEALHFALEHRGIPVREVKHNYSYRVRNGLTKYHSITLKAQVHSREQLWAVDVASTLPWMTGAGSQTFHLLSEMFTIALTTPEEKRPQKYFIVLDTLPYYEQEVERFTAFEMPIDTHILLVSTGTKSVKKECVLPRLGGWRAEALFPHPRIGCDTVTMDED